MKSRTSVSSNGGTSTRSKIVETPTMKTHLVLDCNYLMWRAFHTTGHLSYGEEATGAVFGFFKALETLKTRFTTDRLIFCFDHGKSLRKQQYPWYKNKLQKLNATDLRQDEEVRRQIEKLKLDYLPAVGYANVLYQPGYEADDVIFSVVRAYLDRKFVIVSGDRDLYQALSPNTRVMLHHPREDRTVSYSSFVTQYGIQPRMWPKVKAVGGCVSDKVPGMPGVGEKTALMYFRGLCPPHKAKQIATWMENDQLYKDCLRVVTLPFPGTRRFAIDEDAYDPRAWRALCDKLGFKSLKEGTDLLYGK